MKHYLKERKHLTPGGNRGTSDAEAGWYLKTGWGPAWAMVIMNYLRWARHIPWKIFQKRTAHIFLVHHQHRFILAVTIICLPLWFSAGAHAQGRAGEPPG